MIAKRLRPYLIVFAIVGGGLVAYVSTTSFRWVAARSVKAQGPLDTAAKKPPPDSSDLILSSSLSGTISSTPHVILIIVDALRSDHVSAYGYGRATTPNLDALVADQGIHFQNATTTSPWTCPANAAVMTGRNPSSLGVSWENTANSIPEQEHTLAEYLHQAGYYTAGFANTYCVKGQLGFDQGFDLYDDSLSSHTSSNKARAEQVNLGVMNWLSNTWTTQLSGTRPLFLFIYYFDPHTWYDPLPPYDTLYDATYTGTLTAAVYRDGQDVVSGQITPTARDVEHLIALYDGEITYWDTYLGQMLAYLQDIHLLDNALVAITADHGELFGEHERWAHGNSIYEEVVRVPLLLRYTDVISPGLIVETPVQNMDLLPTILDLIGLPVPDNLHGFSLRSLVTGGSSHVARDTFSEVDALNDPSHSLYWIAPRTDIRSIRNAKWKLIHHVGQWDADELYLLQTSSPYETDNLLLVEPDRARELRQELLDWFDIYSIYLPCVVK
jgi:arylsulfatase A-like enzyme